MPYVPAVAAEARGQTDARDALIEDLLGTDLEGLVHRARTMADACRQPAAAGNPGLLLGAFMAAGDATGDLLFTHVGTYEAELVVKDILGHPERRDYRVVPRVTFCDPEVASVGLTEREAREDGHIRGSTLEFNDALLGGGLKMINPQATHECACGDSFAIGLTTASGVSQSSCSAISSTFATPSAVSRMACTRIGRLSLARASSWASSRST